MSPSLRGTDQMIAPAARNSKRRSRSSFAATPAGEPDQLRAAGLTLPAR
jgi:hypothetical protein